MRCVVTESQVKRVSKRCVLSNALSRSRCAHVVRREFQCHASQQADKSKAEIAQPQLKCTAHIVKLARHSGTQNLQTVIRWLVKLIKAQRCAIRACASLLVQLSRLAKVDNNCPMQYKA